MLGLAACSGGSHEEPAPTVTAPPTTTSVPANLVDVLRKAGATTKAVNGTTSVVGLYAEGFYNTMSATTVREPA
jgi:hypothetical protein